MKTWQEMAKQFSRVTDKLGKKIDKGIFETVVALNVLDIHTVGSCEGHIDWGVPHPWVDIEASLSQKYQIHRYLDQFYQAHHSIGFDCMLGFNGYRLRSNGAAFAPLLSAEEQQQKLVNYQEEMAAFTAFLKALFFQRQEPAISLERKAMDVCTSQRGGGRGENVR